MATKKRPVGRPRKANGATTLLKARCTQEERAQAEKAAREQQENLSDYIRTAVERRVKRGD